MYVICILHSGLISALTNDHFSRDTHMRIILGNKAVLKKSTSDTKYCIIISILCVVY